MKLYVNASDNFDFLKLWDDDLDEYGNPYAPNVADEVEDYLYGSREELDRIISIMDGIVDLLENGPEGTADKLRDAMHNMREAIHECHMAVVNSR